MSDLLRIKGLRVQTVIGTSAEERSGPQAVLVDIDAAMDLRRAGTSDDLAGTVDYGELVSEVEALAEAGERRLLERLAQDVAELVLGKAGVTSVVVEIGKVEVPVPQETSGISVRIERSL